MPRLNLTQVCTGVYYLQVEEAGLDMLCGCPADSVKHLMKRGLIVTKEKDGVTFETGPNAILLSDVMIQNGNFANMAEFPVLQMLYRQGIMIPGHPNNTGTKPLLVGSQEQVKSQMQYIYRGNYGLISKEEIEGVCHDAAQAEELMRLKLRFAFGRIQPTENFLDSCLVNDEKIEIKNGVFIERKALNRFEVTYKDETADVNLNLPEKQDYPTPYNLGHYLIKREYFGVIHSGQGDGWDINRPTMSGILMFQGKIYLIDAGPNIMYALTALGIGINEIEGIFHTHAHDDHFAGITTLMRSDHKIKYYATPLVRASVIKKISALLSMNESEFYHFFDVQTLEEGVYNDIDGLEVRPIFSPHPVETTILFFRTIWEGQYKSYAHFADIVALQVLEKMITDDEKTPGVSRGLYEMTKAEYLQFADLKKLDIGGGMIHGDSEDFKEDNSGKIILAHTALDLTNRQKEIGSSAPFGIVDVLIPVVQDYFWRFSYHYLVTYFPSVPSHQIHILLNCPVETFNPETIILKEGQPVSSVYLILGGTVEIIQTANRQSSRISAGALIGENASLVGRPVTKTYRAQTYVQTLSIPVSLYLQFIHANKLAPSIKKQIGKREFIQRTFLFGDEISYPIQNRIVSAIEEERFEVGHLFNMNETTHMYLIVDGSVTRYLADEAIEDIKTGEYFGAFAAVFQEPLFYKFIVTGPLTVYKIPGTLIDSIPIVRWKLFEQYEKLKQKVLSTGSDAKQLFRWEQHYSVNVLEMDNHHKKILQLIENFIECMGDERECVSMERTLENLIDYARYHFYAEEQLMLKYDYPKTDEHITIHTKLIRTLEELQEQMQRGEALEIKKVSKLFQEWLVIHIHEEDKEYSRFLNDKGIF